MRLPLDCMLFSAAKKVGKGFFIDGTKMLTADETVVPEKVEQFWMNAFGTLPVLNSWPMELPARAIAKTLAGRNVDTE